MDIRLTSIPFVDPTSLKGISLLAAFALAGCMTPARLSGDKSPQCVPADSGLSTEEFDRYLRSTIPAMQDNLQEVIERSDGFELVFPRDPDLARALGQYVANEGFC